MKDSTIAMLKCLTVSMVEYLSISILECLTISLLKRPLLCSIYIYISRHGLFAKKRAKIRRALKSRHFKSNV